MSKVIERCSLDLKFENEYLYQISNVMDYYFMTTNHVKMNTAVTKFMKCSLA